MQCFIRVIQNETVQKKIQYEVADITKEMKSFPAPELHRGYMEQNIKINDVHKFLEKRAEIEAEGISMSVGRERCCHNGKERLGNQPCLTLLGA